MGLFENFPYTNFQQMNLDWIIKKTKELESSVKNIDNTVQSDVNEILNDWKNDGTLADLINQDVFNQISAQNIFNNKNIMCYGDSTGALPNSAFNRLSDKLTNSTIINKSVSGASITPLYNNNIINQINAADLQDTDIVLIAGGINDWQNSASLDNIDTYTTSIINTIYNANKNILIIWLLPFYSYRVFANGVNINNIGLNIPDYNNKIAEVCNRHGVGVIDQYSISGCNQYNYATLLEQSGDTGIYVHPTYSFGEKLADLLISETMQGYKQDNQNYDTILPQHIFYTGNIQTSDLTMNQKFIGCPIIKINGSYTSENTIQLTGDYILTFYSTAGGTVTINTTYTFSAGYNKILLNNMSFNNSVTFNANAVISGIRICPRNPTQQFSGTYGVPLGLPTFSGQGLLLTKHGLELYMNYKNLTSAISTNGTITTIPYNIPSSFFYMIIYNPTSGANRIIPGNITNNTMITLAPIENGERIIIPSQIIPIHAINIHF